MLIILALRLALILSTCDARDYAPSERDEALAYCAEHVADGRFDVEAKLLPEPAAQTDAIPADAECAQY